MSAYEINKNMLRSRKEGGGGESWTKYMYAYGFFFLQELGPPRDVYSKLWEGAAFDISWIFEML